VSTDVRSHACSRQVRRRIAFSLLGFVPLLLGGCAAVAPRLPAPLPDGSVAVGAFAGGGGGGLGSSAYLVPYGVGFAGASIAWQAARFGDLSLELDGELGAGFPSLPGASLFGGAQGGARLWYLLPGLALGVDTGATAVSGTMQSQNAFQGGGTAVLTLASAELRALAALRIADTVWVGTRPGAMVLWASNSSSLSVVPELPLALVWDLKPLRLGIEAAWLVPYGGRAGASAAWCF
jgi:hypothetical protein